jgi:hypothetical protein
MPNFDDIRGQVADALRARFFPLIPQLPVNWTADQHDKNRLSRSLGAFAISHLAHVSPAQAANAVTDGGNDNGLDAVLFDRADNHLWLVQAKAGGAPDLGECKKFTSGIRDLINGRFDKFNQSFERIQPDVEEALSAIGVKVVGCVVHQGEQLGPHATADFTDAATELNQFVNRFEWRDVGVTGVHEWLTEEHAIEAPDVAFKLEAWYGIAHPRRAFYGLIDASELAALFRQHSKGLFQKNIRYYLGNQSVNSAIATTVQERPDDLFYLNNGLTAVCSSIIPVPGGSNQAARFATKGFSIVNGAQTVGSIAAAAARGDVPAAAKVLITVIEVPEGDGAIGSDITRARNTQNAVRGMHFAALDPQQERLRQELAVSGFQYQYRPSAEMAMDNPNTVTLTRAAVALACLSGDTKVVVAAKRESGLLYDGSGELYSQLFRADLSGVRVARSVQIYDHAMDALVSSELAEAAGSRRKMFYRHGRMFILHIFARRHRALVEAPHCELTSAEKADVSRGVIELAEVIYPAGEAMFRDGRGYLSVFRNLTDCVPLAADVMRRLATTAPVLPPAGSIGPIGGDVL